MTLSARLGCPLALVGRARLLAWLARSRPAPSAPRWWMSQGSRCADTDEFVPQRWDRVVRSAQTAKGATHHHPTRWRLAPPTPTALCSSRSCCEGTGYRALSVPSKSPQSQCSSQICRRGRNILSLATKARMIRTGNPESVSRAPRGGHAGLARQESLSAGSAITKATSVPADRAIPAFKPIFPRRHGLPRSVPKRLG